MKIIRIPKKIAQTKKRADVESEIFAGQ